MRYAYIEKKQRWLQCHIFMTLPPPRGVIIWCRWRGANPPVHAATGFLKPGGCQFHHTGTEITETVYLISGQKSRAQFRLSQNIEITVACVAKRMLGLLITAESGSLVNLTRNMNNAFAEEQKQE